MTKPKKTRGTPKRARTKVRPKPLALKALERRLLAVTGKPRARKPDQVLPPEAEEERNLTDEIMLGGFGLVELKLTPEEEAVLAEPVPLDQILIKPTGAVYLSHPSYTRWFNRAFGRTGWALVPAAKPVKADNCVVCPYVMYVHGKPVAFAQGEQEYFANNRDQSYGDALESTVASALRRCSKRLGVGLELWDRAWTNAYLDEHAVHVKVIVKNKREQTEEERWQWRRKTDAPFWNEVGSRAPRQESRGKAPAPATKEERVGTNPAAAEKITQAQRQRLFVISRNSGRTDEEIKAWLKRRYSVTGTEQITRRDYDAICTAIESPADLP